MSPFPRTPTAPMLVASLVVLGALAGCLGSEDVPPTDDATAAGYASFAEALDAAGATLEPGNAESPIRLKVLLPADLTDASEGEQRVVILLYDHEASEPVTDAAMRIKAEMPSMGHGTSGEVDPEHLAFGVYEGKTNFAMPGAWRLNLDARLADGTLLTFDADVQVGGSGDMGHGDMNHDDGMHHDNATYASFEEARAAHGTTYESVNASSSVRLKLLHPMHPHNLSTGTHPITVLLYDADAEAPIRDAHFTIGTWMPAHEHGTSDEAAPTHEAHGVYEGHTNLSMAGDWVLHLNATMADGSALAFEVPLTATSGHDDEDGMHHGDHEGMGHEENTSHDG